MESLRHILLDISNKSGTAWIYLPENRKWSLDCECAILESEEVPPELEDEPDAGIPEIAKANGLMQVLPVVVVQDIVSNARAQKTDLSEEELFLAFMFYFENDSFIRF